MKDGMKNERNIQFLVRSTLKIFKLKIVVTDSKSYPSEKQSALRNQVFRSRSGRWEITQPSRLSVSNTLKAFDTVVKWL